MTVLCEIFKSSRRQEMYLYVEKSRGVEDVPEDLLRRFGERIPVMVLALSPERKLARADVTEVIDSIAKQGFYLQMPPTMAELQARESGRG
tara:strand:- start:1136 stop:1408 length:273 start_codon:yes stop_codon:yes gene_type:complete